jgi:hypothetical protein
MLRIAAPRDVLLLLCAVALPVLPARAQENATPRDAVEPEPVTLLAGSAQLSPPAATAQERLPVFPPAKRPAALVPLYVSFAGLEALDLQSTYRALHTPGARESNPVARTMVGNPAAFTAVKLATTASFVLATEKLWKKHRVAALTFATVGNAVMAGIVAHNYRVAGK